MPHLRTPHARRSYTLRFKRDVLDAIHKISQREAARRYKVPRRTLRYWLTEEQDIRAFAGSERQRSLKQGGPESMPFAEQLLAYMNGQRHEEKVRFVHVRVYVMCVQLELCITDVLFIIVLF